MYKVINDEAPGYAINIFEKSNSGYALRESGSRHLLQKYNTEFAKSSSQCFFYWGKDMEHHLISY